MKPEWSYLNEETRAINEANYWLDRGYTNKLKVDGLKSDISKKRGKDAAEKLIENMRQEFKKRCAR